MRKVLITAAALSLAVLFTSATPGFAASAPTFQVYVTSGEPTHIDELDPGVGPGDWLLFHDAVVDGSGSEIGTALTRVQVIAATSGDDLAFILDCTVELATGNLVFTGAERFSHLATETAFALAGGTGEYGGVEGQVRGAPATVDGAPVTELTFELAKK